MDITNVPIPKRMQSLPRDVRGYPIPIIVFRDAEGKPHFTINAEGSRALVVIDDLCSICGQPLLAVRWFIGGPRSAFDPHGSYADPPVHRDCMRYAMRVCPWLAVPNFAKRIDGRTLRTPDEERRVFIDTTQDPNKPALFVAVGAKATLIGGQRDARLLSPFLKAQRPYAAVEFWHAGRQLAREAGLQLVPADLRVAARTLST